MTQRVSTNKSEQASRLRPGSVTAPSILFEHQGPDRSAYEKKPFSKPSSLGRVALFLHGLTEGGAQRRTLVLAEGLAARGIDVHLLVVDDKGPLREMVPSGVKIVVIGEGLSRLPWIRSRRAYQVYASIFSLAKYLRRVKPDVLVSAANHTALATVSAHRIARCPQTALVLRVSNALISRARPFLWVHRYRLKSALRHVDGVATVTQALAAEVELLCSHPRPGISTVVNPVVDPDLLERSRFSSPAWDDDGRPVVVGLGRLVVQKDFATLIRAFALLPQSHEARLVILGEGPERDALEALARSLGIEERVSLPGRVADPLSSLRAARLFVLSSQWEGLPGGLVEAMACGCAVVSTDCAGAREVLLDGKLAALVPVGDAVAMARAISEHLDHRMDTAALVSRAMAFSTRQAIEDFVEVLDGARQRRQARS